MVLVNKDPYSLTKNFKNKSLQLPKKMQNSGINNHYDKLGRATCEALIFWLLMSLNLLFVEIS